MPTSIRNLSILGILAIVFLTGCATTRARRPEPQDPSAQIAALQNEVQAKDQQIQDLQYQLDSSQRSIGTNYSSRPSSSSSSGSIVRASGVSISDVQRALIRAGFDPGPVDGKAGRRTKSAIKEFQRRNGLTADGVVGERTWSLLR